MADGSQYMYRLDTVVDTLNYYYNIRNDEDVVVRHLEHIFLCKVNMHVPVESLNIIICSMYSDKRVEINHIFKCY